MLLSAKGGLNLKIAQQVKERVENKLEEIIAMTNAELSSLIINRLYYGVLLLAKQKAINAGCISSDDRPSHREIWESASVCVVDEKRNTFLQNFSILRNKRNLYDYNSVEDNNVEQDLQECFRLAEYIQNDLQN